MSNNTYQQKLDKTFKWFILVLMAIFVIGRAMYACHEMKTQPSVEEQLNDTLFQDHSKIPEEIEEDSIVFTPHKVGVFMYHADRIVAVRPNKTWDWLVLDSPGYRMAIVKAKRRDSL